MASNVENVSIWWRHHGVWSWWFIRLVTKTKGFGVISFVNPLVTVPRDHPQIMQGTGIYYKSYRYSDKIANTGTISDGCAEIWHILPCSDNTLLELLMTVVIINSYFMITYVSIHNTYQGEYLLCRLYSIGARHPSTITVPVMDAA